MTQVKNSPSTLIFLRCVLSSVDGQPGGKHGMGTIIWTLDFAFRELCSQKAFNVLKRKKKPVELPSHKQA